MQARYVSTLVATTALVATLGLFVMAASAAETEHDKHVFVNNFECAQAQAGYVGSANGGVWRTTDGASSTSPSDVAAPPAESDALKYNFGGIDGAASEQAPPSCEDLTSGAASRAGNPLGDGVVVLASEEPQAASDGLLIIRHLFGAAETPPEAASADGPQMDGVVLLNSEPQADPLTDGLLVVRATEEPLTDGLMLLRAMPPAAENEQPGSVQSGQQEQAGLLLPAVQKVREAAATAEGGTGTGTLTLSGSSPPAPAPEQQVQAQQQQAAAEEEPRQRRRRMPNFNISIGGVTVGSGGVSVAAGDVTGDGRDTREGGRQVTRAPSASTTRPARADYAGTGTSNR